MKLKSSLTKTCWQDIREEVHGIDSYLAGIIDEINPSNDLPLYIAEYPYGEIIDDGIFFYPDENGDLRPLSDSKLSRQVRDDFEYAGEATPVGIVLDKTIELFTESTAGITPFGLYSKGSCFGLSKFLNEKKSFFPHMLTRISAGARSIYMLPKIGDKFFHKNLRHLMEEEIEPPKALHEHWNVFRSLTSGQPERANWRVKILLISSEWVELIRHSTKWSPLKLNLLEKAWNRFDFDVSRPFFDVAFSEIQNFRNLQKMDPYITDTAKHIFRIIAGGSPGFSLACNNDCAPIEFLQQLYIDTYKLGKYFPDIFVPEYFDQTKFEQVLYYSFQMPTTLEFSPKSRGNLTTLEELREVKKVISIFSHELFKVQTKLGNHELADTLKNLDIDFFHDKPDMEKKIQQTQDLHTYDSNLAADSSYQHAYSGTFLRGCVAIKNLLERFDTF